MLEAEARERQLATLKQNTPLGKKLTNGVSEAPEPRQADDSPLPKKLGNGAHENTGRKRIRWEWKAIAKSLSGKGTSSLA